MKFLLIRDDDISSFTKPAILEKLYGKFLQEKKPVNFAVIPKISANIRTDIDNPYRKYEKLEYDPIIPPNYRGRNEDFQLNKKSDIAEFIRSIEACEVLQHGLTHGLIGDVKEFRIRDNSILQERANEGREILKKCFDINPCFFVAPWDNLSSEAFHLLESSYKGLSMGRINPVRLPSQSWGSYLKKTISSKNFMFYNSLLVVEHSGYLLSRFKEPYTIIRNVQAAIEKSNVIVLINHHWEYFYDWGELDSSLFKLWDKVSEYILQKKDLMIITFNELYRLLRKVT